MVKGKRFKIVLSVLIVLSIGVAATVYWLQGSDSVEQVGVLGEDDLGEPPYIVSVCPVLAYEQEEYVCLIRFVDRDSSEESISVEVLEGPNWLEMDGLLLKGYFPKDSEGTYEVVLRISDGYNSSVQTNYILVKRADES